MSSDPDVEALWDIVPTINCKGLCQAACTGIGMSQREWNMLDAAGHGDIGYDENTEHCNKLGAFGQCTIYELRPMICRVWGASEALPCPYGCTAVMNDGMSAALNLAMMRLSDEWIYIDEGATHFKLLNVASHGKVQPLPRIKKET